MQLKERIEVKSLSFVERSALPSGIAGFMYKPPWCPHSMAVVVAAIPQLEMVEYVQKDEAWSEETSGS